jgi:hypothetical protein
MGFVMLENKHMVLACLLDRLMSKVKQQYMYSFPSQSGTSEKVALP